MPSVAADAISSSIFDGMVQFLRVILLMFSDMSLVISFFFHRTSSDAQDRMCYQFSEYFMRKLSYCLE